jgi:hypothetical protein
MSQANVYYTLSNTTVYTDKVLVNCDDTFTYQVYAVGLVTPYGNGVTYTANAVGNLYSQPVGYPAGSYELYSGAGNKITITTSSANLSVLELGTASSATASVTGS